MHCGAFLGDIDTVSVCTACTSSIFAPHHNVQSDEIWTRCPHCRAPIEVDEPWCGACASLISEATWTEYADQFWVELDDMSSDEIMVCCASTRTHCDCAVPLGNAVIDTYAARDEAYVADAQCFRCAYFYTAECEPLREYIIADNHAALADQDPPRFEPIAGCTAFTHVDGFDHDESYSY